MVWFYDRQLCTFASPYNSFMLKTSNYIFWHTLKCTVKVKGFPDCAVTDIYDRERNTHYAPLPSMYWQVLEVDHIFSGRKILPIPISKIDKHDTPVLDTFSLSEHTAAPQTYRTLPEWKAKCEAGCEYSIYKSGIPQPSKCGVFPRDCTLPKTLGRLKMLNHHCK